MILCEKFVSLNPLVIDEYRAIDVFKMVRNLNIYSERKGKETDKYQENKDYRAPLQQNKKHRVKVTD